ncbi:polysaccharide biosynthesis/export family protein [Roseibium sp.]|uniref:polysaccharide biosynthesis/export family protein n=1 Tax=Roseibium sp. TaxID=1936156 RepID=UPI003A9870D7
MFRVLQIVIVGAFFSLANFGVQPSGSTTEHMSGGSLPSGGISPSLADEVASDVMSDAGVMVGDSINISFFEASEGQDGRVGATYRRDDLSGDYQVSAGGNISIPLLGEFEVKGTSLVTLSDQLASATESLGSRQMIVRAHFTKRPPVYVTGNVKIPGAYEYIPGMSVAKLIALASGLKSSASDIGLVPTILEAREDHSLSQLRLAKAVAEKIRVEAELKGHWAVTDPAAFDGLVDAQRQRDFLRDEEAVFHRNLAVWTMRVEAAREKVALRRGGVQAAQQAVSAAGANREQVDGKLQAWDDVYLPKYFQKSVAASKKRELDRFASLQVAQQEVESKVRFLQAQSVLADAEHELYAMRAERDVTLEAKRADLSTQIEELRRRVDVSSRKLKAWSPAALAANGRLGRENEITIIRSGQRGDETLQAVVRSQVRPGDVVQVQLGSPQLSETGPDEFGLSSLDLHKLIR